MAATIGSALRWWGRTQPDTTALVVEDEKLSYGQLDAWTSRIARSLSESGVGPGDRVGVLGPNSLEWPVIALGVIKSGAVLIPLNPRYKPAELRQIVDDAGIGTVIAPPDFAVGVDATRELGTDFTHIPFGTFEALRDGQADDFRVDLAPEEPTAILFTSGSTGRSKGVICTNQSLLNIVFEASLTEEGLRQGTTTLLVLPLVFTPGLVWGLLMTTVLGGTLVVEKELVPSRAARLLGEHKVQALFGVPLIFQAISSAPEFAEADLSQLKTAIVGGAAVPTDLLATWADKGVKLRQIYGMTEAGGVATATIVSEYKDHPTSCGSGSIFTELKVVDADGNDLPPGEAGEILIKGPGVTPGYWNEPEQTAEAIRDGWLHTGDLGKRDEEGRITFVDRLKDLIITGGINVSPVELERVISQIPGVKDVVVIAAPDEKFGETPAAIITAEDGIETADIIEHCSSKLADFKVPRYVVIKDGDLPRLPSGKLARTQVRSDYADIPARFPKVR